MYFIQSTPLEIQNSLNLLRNQNCFCKFCINCSAKRLQTMHTIYKFVFFFVIFICLQLSGRTQVKLTQLSGFTVDAVTEYPLPYTSVEIKGTWRGTAANSLGFFSLAVAANDTIQFSTVGYEPKMFIVPDTITNDMTSIGVFLKRDTILLDVVVIYPWPSREDFQEAFVGLQLAREERSISILGIKGVEQIDTVPKEPTIFQPISLLYEEVIKPIEYKRKKRKIAKLLPKWE